MNIHFYPPGAGIVIGLFILLLLLVVSALVSGSEVAYFSLSPSDLDHIRSGKSRNCITATRLNKAPERLLATILITNNLVNVGIVILCAFLVNSMIDLSSSPPWLSFLLQVVIITFLLLLFGEILPKIYANTYSLKFALFMSLPLSLLVKFFHPLSGLLIRSTSLVNKKFGPARANISMDDISDALELPATEIHEDERILRGIATFANTEVSEIMRSRIDVIAVDIATNLEDLLRTVIESGYSRIPVFEDTFDNLRGILYTKDLLPYIHEKDTFRWQNLIHAPYYVPETKKINELLKEFQAKKIHMAVVIDEYGGSQGIVTLEDILEEIVGEIRDEFDEDELTYSRLDERTYVFEGKTLLNDFCKVIDIPVSELEEVRGEADTLAGLILEMSGEIPSKNELFHFGSFTFRVESVDKRRIKKIRITTKGSA